jgi:hypothetical protein
MFGFYNLLILSFLAFLPSWSAADGFTGTVEVDLIFPRNDTYATTELMPVVFAIQSPQTASSMEISIRWGLLQITGDNSSQAHDAFSYPQLENYQSTQNNNPFFETDSIFNTTNIEGSWYFYWVITTANCSSVSAFLSNSSSFPDVSHRKDMIFTTKNGAPMPDLVAATAEDTCAAGDQSFTFDITDSNMVLPIPNSGKITTYAVLASTSPTPSPNPCAATIDAPAASSISAGLTSSFCYNRSPQTLVTCPPPVKTGGGMGRYSQSGRMIWLIAPLGWLLHNFVV